MKVPLSRRTALPPQRSDDSMRQRFKLKVVGIVLLSLFSPLVHGQPASAEVAAVHSFSGQFTVTASRGFSLLHRSSAVATDTNLVRLESALVAVAAERFKSDLWHELGFKPDTAWSGKIFLALQPARSRDDGVTIASSVTLRAWNYRVELPDVLLQTRYARALTAVLLLEIANRTASAERSAEIPAWLVDGLAQQILATDAAKVMLSTPARNLDGLPQSRLTQSQSGIDVLANIRTVLNNSPALTFEQLSWPTETQVDGADDGVYRASTQLLASELLSLADGPACMRNFLARLPACFNWQTAFFAAFKNHFRSPLDVEKWWALRVLNFSARNPGPLWSPAVSRQHLDRLLSVPVEIRTGSNALPSHAEITLQSALRNFTEAQLAAVLAVKLRDLELAQFRLTPPLAVLAGNYRKVLGNFLGNQNPVTPAAGAGKNAPAMRRRVSLDNTLKQLDELDARCRKVEATLRTGVLK